jgi:hypothetical protein
MTRVVLARTDVQIYGWGCLRRWGIEIPGIEGRIGRLMRIGMRLGTRLKWASWGEKGGEK